LKIQFALYILSKGNLKIAKIKSGAEKTDIFDRFSKFFSVSSGKTDLTMAKKRLYWHVERSTGLE
jgi:hypothetical protein